MAPKRNILHEPQEQIPKLAKEGGNNGTLVPIIPEEISNDDSIDKPSKSVVKSTQNVITNQMVSTSHLFQNASFSNCNSHLLYQSKKMNSRTLPFYKYLLLWYIKKINLQNLLVIPKSGTDTIILKKMAKNIYCWLKYNIVIFICS